MNCQAIKVNRYHKGWQHPFFVPILRAKSHTFNLHYHRTVTITDEAIDTYTSYVKKRIDQGLPWQSSAEIFSNWLQGEPVYPVYGKRADSES